MLLFSTVLSIRESLTKDDFIRLVIEWNQGSDHMENRIIGIEWAGERNVRYGDKSLWMDIQEYRNQNTIAVRYEKTEEDGAIWDTDYVMNFTTRKMSILLDRSYKADALLFDPGFSTPHFITMLIMRGYLLDDGALPVSRDPIQITEENIGLLTDVILNKARYQLPVVYVSKTYDNEDPVDVRLLASRLKGVAHVLVQSDAKLNRKCRQICNDRNEFFGAIGIYYPNFAAGNTRYLYRKSDGFDENLFEKVRRSVIRYSNAQEVCALLTWQGVNNALLADRLACQRSERIAAEEARDKAETDVDATLGLLDSEFDEMKRAIEALTKTNDALRSENEGLRTRLTESESIPVIYMGEEDDLYVGEIKDIILAALQDVLKNRTEERTRKSDVLKDILRTNAFTRNHEDQKQTIKNMFRGYSGLNRALRQQLIDLGFDITDDGKHYKFMYLGDRRYWTTVSKTPGDCQREGKNIAAEIIKTIL